MAEEKKDRLTEQLIRGLQQRLSVSNLNDRLEQEAKQHREHLERLSDRTMNVLYTVAAIIAGGAAIFGFKTYIDVAEKTQAYVNQRVTSQFEEKFAEEERNKLIAEYKRAAVVVYYAARASDEKFRNNQLPGPDMKAVLETLDQSESPYFQDALRVVRSYDCFRRDQATTVTKKLGEILAKMIKSPEITSNSPVFVVEAIASMWSPEAYEPLFEIATSRSQSRNVRNAALAGLLKICPEGKKRNTAETLLQNSGGLRKQGISAYLPLLNTALQLDFKLALPEAVALAKSNDPDEVKRFPELLNRELLHNADADVCTQVEALIKCFVTNRLVAGLQLDAQPSGVSQDEPELILIILPSNRTEAIEGKVLTPSFIRAIKDSLCETVDANRVLFLRSWIQPLIEFGTERFEYEKRCRKIGLTADRNHWQDGLTVSRVSAGPPKAVWQIVSVRDNNVTLRVRPNPTGLMESRDESVIIGDIDWSTLAWEPKSVLSRTTTEE